MKLPNTPPDKIKKRVNLGRQIQKLFTTKPQETGDLVATLFPLLALPNDIIVYLAQFLSYDTLYNLIQANHRLRDLFIIPLYRRFLDQHYSLNVVDTLRTHDLHCNKGTVHNLLKVGAPLHKLLGNLKHLRKGAKGTLDPEPYFHNTILLAAEHDHHVEILDMIASSMGLQTSAMIEEFISPVIFLISSDTRLYGPGFHDGACRTMLHFICSHDMNYVLDNRWILHELKERGVTKARQIMRGVIETYRVHINRRDLDGRTPLHWAARGPGNYMVKALLDSGADANVASSAGITPLHIAARNESFTTALATSILLLRHRADKHARIPSTGRTARDLVLRQNREGLTLSQEMARKCLLFLLK